ncbi:MAG: hypothetical protein CL921_08635, partial [Deltaproteobacteria bacterium]|nr:hypothetical protein [Deltaproteobacteria bacterium]
MLVARTKLIIQELVLPSAIVLLIYNASLALLRKNPRYWFPVSNQKTAHSSWNPLQISQWAIKKYWNGSGQLIVKTRIIFKTTLYARR